MATLTHMMEMFTPQTFRAEIREISAASGEADNEVYTTLTVPTSATISQKNGRTVFSIVYPNGPIIPAKFHLTLFRNNLKANTESEVIAFNAHPNIPTIDESVIEMISDESKPNRAAAHAAFGKLTEEMWLQLNPATDKYTLQLKLKKVIPRIRGIMCRKRLII